MQKSKLFADVHVSAPTYSRTPLSTQGTAKGMPRRLTLGKLLPFIFFANLILMAYVAYVVSTPSPAPKSLSLEAPHRFSEKTPDTSVRSPAHDVASPFETDVFKSQQAKIDAQRAQLDKLLAEVTRTQEELNSKTQPSSDNQHAPTPASPTHTVTSDSSSTPVSIDRHGIILVLDNYAFQCSARGDVPVCVGVGPYMDTASKGK